MPHVVDGTKVQYIRVPITIPMAKTDWTRELKKGSVQLCIMALLRRERMYGSQIIRELKDVSGGYFDLKEGTLYPALHRMEKRGYLKSEWVQEGDSPPKKFYRLTKEGEAAYSKATAEWERMVSSTSRVLEEAE